MNKHILLTLFTFIFIALGVSEIKAQSKVKLTNLFIGTAGDHGQVSPAACVPYGMIQVGPDMVPRSHSGYDYDINTISGFSLNRLSGIGCDGAGGNITIKPAIKNINPTIKKETEQAYPGYYAVELDSDVKTEFTATRNVAFERFTFAKGAKKQFTLDATTSFGGTRETMIDVVSDTEMQGYVVSGNTCGNGSYKLYFNLKSNKPFTITSQESTKIVEFAFSEKESSAIELRIALSPISYEKAHETNLLLQYDKFEKIKKEASVKWEDILSRVDIKGATEDEKILFYTSLYRVFLSPANVTSYDKQYLGTDGNVYKFADFTYYSSWSMWDSYRTKFPLITLLDPATMTDISKSLCKLFVNGKKDWATDYESTPTVRTEHSMVVLLDAYRKGIKFNIAGAYKGMQDELTTLQTKSPDQAFETCIDYWTMWQIAQELDKRKDIDTYKEKADELFLTTWENNFKDIDDSFTKMKDSGLYQGTRWQYRWAVPQYLSQMQESVGGKDVLLKQLTYYFDNNLSNQTNEPGLHTPYLFNRIGAPEKAQNISRTILTEEMKHLYGGNAEYKTPVISKTFRTTPDGFLPEMDEDDGTMSAFYVFGAIGLYPLIVGEPWYEITSPLYDQITIQLDGKKQLVIKTVGRTSKDAPIQSIFFNGKSVDDYRINHNDLVKGGILEIKY